MSTWHFGALDDERDGDLEQDFMNGLQEPEGGRDFWDEYVEYERPSSSHADASTQHPPPPDYSDALTLEDDDRRELDRLERQRRELELPVPLPYLERQQSEEELGLNRTGLNSTELSTPTSYDSHEFVTLEDSDSEDEIEADDMAPTRRSQRASVVDLTEGSPRSTTSRQPKRKRSTTTAAASSSAGTKTKRRRLSADIEEIDLANEAPSAEEELLQAQQQEAIRSQQQATEDAVPQKIGQRSCIICLENFTNATATSCGHFFCHECLIQALRAAAKNNDRGTGSCPVCRKGLKENKKGDVIPISFMTKKEYDRQHKIRA